MGLAEPGLGLQPLRRAVERRAFRELAPDDGAGQGRIVVLAGPLAAVHHDRHAGSFRYTRGWHGERPPPPAVPEARLFDLPALEAAAALVHAALPPTPQYAWPLLAARTGAEVWVKHENHTPTGAFKVRGGLVYMDRLRARAAAMCAA